ncbi:hypothetical protein SKAU_G00308230 [Synaphobranchus kaupii]|uniref:Uncharacterized protein n=1 Tax=Synaphobranchus kaupii TaxID=118154 RepID=A0A9Q1IIW1_SYNKA|nr:hypothetical protein SKAU_G00308230 [Synaphobranchus kaupii]
MQVGTNSLILGQLTSRFGRLSWNYLRNGGDAPASVGTFLLSSRRSAARRVHEKPSENRTGSPRASQRDNYQPSTAAVSNPNFPNRSPLNTEPPLPLALEEQTGPACQMKKQGVRNQQDPLCCLWGGAGLGVGQGMWPCDWVFSVSAEANITAVKVYGQMEALCQRQGRSMGL